MIDATIATCSCEPCDRLAVTEQLISGADDILSDVSASKVISGYTSKFNMGGYWRKHNGHLWFFQLWRLLQRNIGHVLLAMR